MMHLDYYDDAPELPERWYFYSVLGTVAPDYLRNLIQNQTKLRVEDDVIKEEAS